MPVYEIAFLEKGRAAPVAALGDMVRHTGQDQTGKTRHHTKAARAGNLVNCHRNRTEIESSLQMQRQDHIGDQHDPHEGEPPKGFHFSCHVTPRYLRPEPVSGIFNTHPSRRANMSRGRGWIEQIRHRPNLFHFWKHLLPGCLIVCHSEIPPFHFRIPAPI